MKKETCSNCTFMELKYPPYKYALDFIKFKLYLYGIEIDHRQVCSHARRGFKLYLYGIEISLITTSNGTSNSSNCTFMELKWVKFLDKTRQEFSSNCTFMELK